MKFPQRHSSGGQSRLASQFDELAKAERADVTRPRFAGTAADLF